MHTGSELKRNIVPFEPLIILKRSNLINAVPDSTSGLSDRASISPSVKWLPSGSASEVNTRSVARERRIRITDKSDEERKKILEMIGADRHH